MAQYNEVVFEREFAGHLAGAGWLYSADDIGYDRERALFPADIWAWLETTQGDELAKVVKPSDSNSTQEKARTRLLDRLVKVLDSDLSRDGGTLRVLRHGFKDISSKFSMCEFRPGDDLNKAVLDRYAKVRLRVMRQVHYSLSNAKKSIDLVFFVNGLPVATVELKTTFTQTAEEAVDQYRKNRLPVDPKTRKREPLLTFGARALVHFAMDNDEVWMTTNLRGDHTYFLPFNKGDDGRAGNPINPDGSKTAYFWEEVLQRDTWLNIIGKFMHLSVTRQIDPVSGDETVRESLLFPRYHQLQVVDRLLDAARTEGPGHRYLIQHSAGSGKTNSIGWAAHRLSTLHHVDGSRVFHTVIVVTDRTVLDTQLSDAIYQIEHKQGMVVQITDKGSGPKSAQLAKALGEGASIVTVTIQTFPFALDAIRHSASLAGKNFAIIADEAHSSQSGTASAKLKAVLSPEEQEDLEDGGEIDIETLLLADAEQRADAKNISYFAFTATPKGKTMQLFGRPGPDGLPVPFHVYTMQQAIEEGFILDVLKNYTPYKVAFQLAHGGKDYDSESPLVDKSDAAKALMRWVRLHPHNIRQKVQVIVEHFHQNVAWRLDGHAKAMVVTGSRKEAVSYKLAMDGYIKDAGYNSEIATLVAFSGEVKDQESGPEPFSETSMNTGLKKRTIAKAFGTDEFQVLLVANKFQTGFDQPLLCAMYVDKKLSGVTAVQTLSRLNRTSRGKDQTFVIDFVNKGDDILAAFLPYYREALLSGVTDPNIVHDLQAKLDAADVYTEHDVERFAKAWWTNQGNNAASAALAPAKSRFNTRYDAAMGAEDEATLGELDLFRGDLTAFVNAYDFLSQIVNYADTDLEKRAMFYRLLAREVADKKRHKEIDLTGVEMTHYAIKTPGEQDLKLSSADGDDELKPLGGTGTGSPKDPLLVRLREVLQQMNSLFEGEGLTEGDMIGVYRTVESKILENDDLEKQSKANTRADFYDSIDLWPIIIEAVLEAGDNHSKGIERLLDEGNRDKFLKALQLGGLYEKLRGDLATGVPPGEPEAD